MPDEKQETPVLADVPPAPAQVDTKNDKLTKVRVLLEDGLRQLNDVDVKMTEARTKIQQQLAQTEKNLIGIAAQKALMTEILQKINE